jgi:large conductance mechanosensitive channel
MTTKKTSKAQAAKKSESATSELLREERRLKRELRDRLRLLEERTGVDAATGAARKQFSGFIDFIREQSVVGLAVGLVLGTQLKALVDSIVLNFISPFLALIMPGKDSLESKAFVIHAFGKASQPFGWGKVLLTLISFVAVAALVYAIFKVLRLDRLAKKKDEPAKDKKDDKKSEKTAAKKAPEAKPRT